MAFIGNSVQNQGFAPAVDYFNGDGTTVTFTLSRPVASVAQLTAVIDNVIQNPSSAFTVSGNAITFTSAPLAGTNNIWVEYTSLITTYAALSQDPSVIGDITASGGYLAVGDFGNTFTDGTIVDYVTGNARITTGPADGLTIYNGGTSARTALTSWSSTGQVGVGVTPSSWSTGKAIETGGNGCGVWGLASGTTYYNAGYYYNSADKFAITGSYALYSQLVPADGSFRWSSSTATGTAGNTATMSERMRIDSSGNVGINQTSPNVIGTAKQLAIKAPVNGDSLFVAQNSNGLTTFIAGYYGVTAGPDKPVIGSYTADAVAFITSNTERMRLSSSGGFLIKCTAPPSGSVFGSAFLDNGVGASVLHQSTSITSANALQAFYNPNGNVGSVGTSGSNAYYATTSDYRLKENIAPMTGALDKVALLKPCTYTWKNSQEDSQGFIAHELAEVCPQAVIGEKDAVDEEGNIKPQNIDTSFLVATLTAAIQEQQAIITSLTARIEALESK